MGCGQRGDAAELRPYRALSVVDRRRPERYQRRFILAGQGKTMKGRKPQPTLLKLVSQSQHLKKGGHDDFEPAGELHAPPEFLSEAQKVGWRAVIKNAPCGMLRQLDETLLTVWVVAAGLHIEATMMLRKDGMVVKAPITGTPVQSPYLAIINRQAEIMLRTASELGFSPTSRTRIAQAGSGKKETNRFANNAAPKRA